MSSGIDSLAMLKERLRFGSPRPEAQATAGRRRSPAPAVTPSQLNEPGSSSTDENFTCFPRLPAELLNAIWDAALDEWAVVIFRDRYDPDEGLRRVYHPGFEPLWVALSCQEAAARLRTLYHATDLALSSGIMARINFDRTVFAIAGYTFHRLLCRYAARPTSFRPVHIALLSNSRVEWARNMKYLEAVFRGTGGEVTLEEWCAYNDIPVKATSDSEGDFLPVKTIIMAGTDEHSAQVIASVLADTMRHPAAGGDGMYTREGIMVQIWRVPDDTLDITEQTVDGNGLEQEQGSESDVEEWSDDE